MVETITPVVHGGRRGGWAVALALHVAGATVAAAVFGAVLGAAGAALDAPWGRSGLAIVGGLAMAYLVAEVFGVRVPIPQARRQVPDWWRTFFGPSPAAFLYGVGLGIGFFTYLAHGTLVVVCAAALASGDPVAGAVAVGAFGLARGLSAVVGFRTGSSEEGALLVSALARSASWIGWRVAHAVALGAVLGASAVVASGSSGTPSDPGSAAAAVLALAFGAAAVAKLTRPRTWGRTLSTHALPGPVEPLVAIGVPAIELVVSALPFLGLAATAGLVSMLTVGVFSVGIVVGRVRKGPRLACGCFGSGAERDWRLLLARNGLLAAVAFVVWTEGSDLALVGPLRPPSGADLVPAALAVLGITLTAWVAGSAVAAVRRGPGR